MRQTILADYRASHQRLRERDPIEILDTMLERMEAAVEELAPRTRRPGPNGTGTTSSDTESQRRSLAERFGLLAEDR
jgi:hypothetical protein